MDSETKTLTELLDDMRAYAATLRGSQAVGALKLIDHLDPRRARPDAPRDHWCAHGGVVASGNSCDGCDAEAKTAHRAELRTFVNPATMRRSVLCQRCRQHPSFYRHTGETL